MAITHGQVIEARSVPRKKLNGEVVAACILILFYMLFPLDRGFPGLPLAGKTVSPAFCASGLVLGYLYLTSAGRILSRFRYKFAFYQLLFVPILVLSSAISKDPVQAFQGCLRYTATFIFDYVILVYLVEKYGENWLAKVVIFGGVTSALIASVDTIIGIRIPLYQKLYDLNTQATGWANAGATAFDTFRAIGTMGNPIIMATLMMVCVPYVFNIKSPVLRVIVFAILFLGAAVTVSRTIAVGVVVFIVGAAFIYGRKFLVTMATSFVVIVVLGLTSVGTFLADDPRVLIWESRLGVPGVQGAENANDNVATRQEVTGKALKQIAGFGPKEIVLGRGVKSTAAVGEDMFAGYSTIDNATVTLLYEEGVLGVTLFYASFFVVLWRSRKKARVTLHWYNILALLACSISFDFEDYSTFNILVVGSLAIISAVPIKQSEDTLAIETVPNLPATQM